MPVLIIYSLVIIFLLAFPLLALSLVQQSPTSLQAQQSTSNTSKSVGISYGLILTFFVLFALLTFVIRKGKGSL